MNEILNILFVYNIVGVLIFNRFIFYFIEIIICYFKV
jgi:hypothetical protein